MEAGIYYDMPFDEYLAIDAISNSILSHFRACPARAKYYQENDVKPTKAMKFGTLMHWGILEPDKFRDRTIIAKQCEAVTGKGSQCSKFGTRIDEHGKYRCGVYHGKDLPISNLLEVSPSDVERIRGAYASVENNPKAALLTGDYLEGANEVTMVWNDPTTTALMKARIDRLVQIDGRNVLVDLKTTSDASPDAFSKSIYNFGYYRQAAMYLSGALALGLKPQDFLFVVVESRAPYLSAVYRIMGDHINKGWDEIEAMIPRFLECKSTGIWPSYTDDEPLDIALPGWVGYEIDSVVHA